MAYADQQMSGNRIAALILVALIHIGIGYVLVSGLAYEAYQEAVERVTTVDIEDEPEPEPEPEELPPPPDEVVETVIPPPFVPPPAQNIAPQRQTQRSTETISRNTEVSRQPTFKTCSDGSQVLATATCGPATKRCPDGTVVRINANCPEPKKEEPKVPPKDAQPRGNPGGWASARDYPSRALREEREGVTRFRLNISAGGDVTGCSITGSSGHPDLDDTTCKLMQRRGRFRAATNGEGNAVASTWASAVRWEIPE